MPADVKAAMIADYEALGSMHKVARKWGRTPQAVQEVMKRAKVPVGVARNPTLRVYRKIKFTAGKGGYLRATKTRDGLAALEYKGENFTREKDGYLRSTSFAGRIGRKKEEILLHRRIWADLHGPIPKSWQVGFKDGDIYNFDPDNLLCLPQSEMMKLKSKGKNGFDKFPKGSLERSLLWFNLRRSQTAATTKVKL
jgi:hypothetical protein